MSGPRAYRMLKDSNVRPDVCACAVVYRYLDYDYGLSRDEEAVTGRPHVSVTLDPSGRASPSFTVPLADLEAIEQEEA